MWYFETNHEKEKKRKDYIPLVLQYFHELPNLNTTTYLQVK